MPDEVLRRVLGLSDELRRFNAVIHSVLHSHHPKADVIGPLLWAAAQSCDSVNKLAYYGKLRDCFSLGRCVWETLLNAAYVHISGDEIADKARKHALQKSYRDLDRSLEVGKARIDMKANLQLNPTAIPGLEVTCPRFMYRLL